MISLLFSLYSDEKLLKQHLGKLLKTWDPKEKKIDEAAVDILRIMKRGQTMLTLQKLFTSLSTPCDIGGLIIKALTKGNANCSL